MSTPTMQLLDGVIGAYDVSSDTVPNSEDTDTGDAFAKE